MVTNQGETEAPKKDAPKPVNVDESVKTTVDGVKAAAHDKGLTEALQSWKTGGEQLAQSGASKEQIDTFNTKVSEQLKKDGLLTNLSIAFAGQHPEMQDSTRNHNYTDATVGGAQTAGERTAKEIQRDLQLATLEAKANGKDVDPTTLAKGRQELADTLFDGVMDGALRKSLATMSPDDRAHAVPVSDINQRIKDMGRQQETTLKTDTEDAAWKKQSEGDQAWLKDDKGGAPYLKTLLSKSPAGQTLLGYMDEHSGRTGQVTKEAMQDYLKTARNAADGGQAPTGLFAKENVDNVDRMVRNWDKPQPGKSDAETAQNQDAYRAAQLMRGSHVRTREESDQVDRDAMADQAREGALPIGSMGLFPPGKMTSAGYGVGFDTLASATGLTKDQLKSNPVESPKLAADTGDEARVKANADAKQVLTNVADCVSLSNLGVKAGDPITQAVLTKRMADIDGQTLAGKGTPDTTKEFEAIKALNDRYKDIASDPVKGITGDDLAKYAKDHNLQFGGFKAETQAPQPLDAAAQAEKAKQDAEAKQVLTSVHDCVSLSNLGVKPGDPIPQAALDKRMRDIDGQTQAGNGTPDTTKEYDAIKALNDHYKAIAADPAKGITGDDLAKYAKDHNTPFAGFKDAPAPVAPPLDAAAEAEKAKQNAEAKAVLGSLTADVPLSHLGNGQYPITAASIEGALQKIRQTPSTDDGKKEYTALQGLQARYNDIASDKDKGISEKDLQDYAAKHQAEFKGFKQEAPAAPEADVPQPGKPLPLNKEGAQIVTDGLLQMPQASFDKLFPTQADGKTRAMTPKSIDETLAQDDAAAKAGHGQLTANQKETLNELKTKLWAKDDQTPVKLADVIGPAGYAKDGAVDSEALKKHQAELTAKAKEVLGNITGDPPITLPVDATAVKDLEKADPRYAVLGANFGDISKDGQKVTAQDVADYAKENHLQYNKEKKQWEPEVVATPAPTPQKTEAPPAPSEQVQKDLAAAKAEADKLVPPKFQFDGHKPIIDQAAAYLAERAKLTGEPADQKSARQFLASIAKENGWPGTEKNWKDYCDDGKTAHLDARLNGVMRSHMDVKLPPLTAEQQEKALAKIAESTVPMPQLKLTEEQAKGLQAKAPQAKPEQLPELARSHPDQVQPPLSDQQKQEYADAMKARQEEVQKRIAWMKGADQSQPQPKPEHDPYKHDGETGNERPALTVEQQKQAEAAKAVLAGLQHAIDPRFQGFTPQSLDQAIAGATDPKDKNALGVLKQNFGNVSTDGGKTVSRGDLDRFSQAYTGKPFFGDQAQPAPTEEQVRQRAEQAKIIGGLQHAIDPKFTGFTPDSLDKAIAGASNPDDKSALGILKANFAKVSHDGGKSVTREDLDRVAQSVTGKPFFGEASAQPAEAPEIKQRREDATRAAGELAAHLGTTGKLDAEATAVISKLVGGHQSDLAALNQQINDALKNAGTPYQIQLTLTPNQKGIHGNTVDKFTMKVLNGQNVTDTTDFSFDTVRGI